MTAPRIRRRRSTYLEVSGRDVPLIQLRELLNEVEGWADNATVRVTYSPPDPPYAGGGQTTIEVSER